MHIDTYYVMKRPHRCTFGPTQPVRRVEDATKLASHVGVVKRHPYSTVRPQRYNPYLIAVNWSTLCAANTFVVSPTSYRG